MKNEEFDLLKKTPTCFDEIIFFLGALLYPKEV
jgi:hypothetical protein